MKIKLPEIISEEEFIQILNKTKHKHHRLGFCLGFYQCLRVSEAVNLKPEHIDKGRKLMMIKQGKGGKDRNIPISPEIMKGLKHLPIGIGIRGLQISFKKKLKEVLGRDDLSFHSLRHSGITHYLNVKKWDLSQLQRLAGHSRLSTTLIYTHISPENLVDKMWE